MSKSKKHKYHKHHKYTGPDGEVTMKTQLYETGVYAIVNDDPLMQFNLTPAQIAGIEKKLRKLESEGEIENLEFSDEITVEEVDGFWKETA